jgi:hypothetical protein
MLDREAIQAIIPPGLPSSLDRILSWSPASALGSATSARRTVAAISGRPTLPGVLMVEPVAMGSSASSLPENKEATLTGTTACASGVRSPGETLRPVTLTAPWAHRQGRVRATVNGSHLDAVDVRADYG